jgi:hypothetical protein
LSSQLQLAEPAANLQQGLSFRLESSGDSRCAPKSTRIEAGACELHNLWIMIIAIKASSPPPTAAIAERRILR